VPNMREHPSRWFSLLMGSVVSSVGLDVAITAAILKDHGSLAVLVATRLLVEVRRILQTVTRPPG
jgi:hypothetical protein